MSSAALHISAYGLTFATFEGSGSLSNGKGFFPCRFRIVQFHDGSILVGCQGLQPLAVVMHAAETVAGTLDDGRDVFIDLHGHTKASLGHELLEPMDIVFAARRVDIGELEDLQGQWAYWLTNLVQRSELVVEISGDCARVVPIDNHAKVEPYLRSAFGVVVTAVLHLPAMEPEQAEQCAEDICHLLSIGTGNRVQWIARSVTQANVEAGRRHVDAVTKRFGGPVGVVPQDLQAFLTRTWPPVHARTRWKLRHLVGVLADARSQTDYLELRCLKSVAAVEVVKDIFLSGATTKSGTFAAKVQALLNEVGSSLTTEDVSWMVKCRNELVHTGEPYSRTHPTDGAPFTTTITEYLWLQQFLSRLMLCIVGYHGPCIDAPPAAPHRHKYLAP